MTDTSIRHELSQRQGAQQDPRLTWWRQARFGMFIHWGLYSVPAGSYKGRQCPGIGEWIMKRLEIPVHEYEQLQQHFNPTKFNAADWVALARESGQKYLIITAKHHDGFCLFKSRTTDYNIVDGTPFGRDVMKELAEECRKQGVKFGFYYSQTQDWHHPDGDGNDWDYVEEKKDFDGYIHDYVMPQLEELLTGYGPISVIWFDTPKRITETQSKALLDHCRALSPDTLISGRLGNALGDYASSGDNKIPSDAVTMDWETPATLNDTWGYKSDDHNWKPAETLIHNLVDITSKGGNYLLNVGPTASGIIPRPSRDRLLQIGKWLHVNGEAVYGTQAGPLQGIPWCRSTFKPKAGTLPARIFLHVFYWPHQGDLAVPYSRAGIARAYLLADPEQKPLAMSEKHGALLLQGPPATPDVVDTVIVLELAD